MSNLLSRFWDFIFGRQLLAGLVHGGMALGWMLFTILGGLAFIVLVPAVAGSVALWTVIAIAVVGSGVILRRLEKPIHQAFGVELKEEIRSLGPLSWMVYRTGPGRMPYAPAVLVKPVVQLVVFAVIVRLLMWGGHSIHHRRFDVFKAEMKGRGLPVSLAEFQESVPDEQYGEAALVAALAKLDPKGDTVKPSPSSLEPWTRKTWEDKEVALKRFEPVIIKEILPLLGRYSRYKKVDFLAASKNSGGMPTPKFAGHIKAGRILGFCAVAHAFQKEPAKAWSYVRAQLDFADLVANDRSLVGKMVTIALRRQAAQSIVVIALTAPDLSLPKDLAKRLESLTDSHLVRDGLGGELAVHFDRRDWMEGASEDLPSVKNFTGESGMSGFALYVGFRVFVLTGAWDLNTLVSAGRTFDCMQAVTMPQARARAAEESSGLANLPLWPYLWMSSFGTYNAPRLLVKEWELTTWLRLGLVAHALNEHRKAAGRFPADLAALAPKRLSAATLVDAFTDRPFAYQLKKDGFELCSAGPKGDKKDSLGGLFCVGQAR